jgi:hypothetical protein
MIFHPMPVISPVMLEFVRAAYGAVLFAFLLLTLPMSRWFFVSERWGGYAQSRLDTDFIQNPRARPLVLALWFACAGSLIVGWQTVAAAFVNLVLCWYFFIYMRWRGILRGGGAPGFMSFWTAACVFFLQLGRHCDPSGGLLPVALLAFQVDYAVIMLCAGTYKMLAGYPRNEGMQLGMANPWWGYWSVFYRRLPYHHVVFKFLNQMAWLTEVVAGILMLLPATRSLGALLIIASFLFITTQIRLGVLCETVMVGAFIFFPAHGLIDQWLARWLPIVNDGPQAFPALSASASALLQGFFWLYICALPLAKIGQYYNFLARRSLPKPFQFILERWTNMFGIIIWRVFSVDVVNFFVRVFIRERNGEEREYTTFGRLDPKNRFRYIHVSEFVCFASLFTTLKYYPSNSDLFRRRLLCYARTIPCPPGAVLRFEYISVVKGDDCFDYVPCTDFIVDPHAGTLEEHARAPGIDVRAAHAVSPVHEGARPGSYAPRSDRT